MVIKPKIRGFICLTAHPEGCAAHIREQIAHIRSKGPLVNGPRKVLVIGSSTGYGLASRIAAAFGSGASTLGLFFEKAPEPERTASTGWYNTVAFTQEAHAAGLYAKNINGDAFSDEVKKSTVDLIKQDLGQVDLVVYSLASPRRTHPRTGATHKSCLKPIGSTYSAKSLDTDRAQVIDVNIEPATETEIADTVAVMGGEDWEWWIDALEQGGVLAPGARTVAYSYIGPEQTYPVYRNGTIGRAKEDLEATAHRLHARLSKSGGGAYVSVNKALVTQASSAIPVVPLYISILYKVMKEKGLHEGCIEQIQRLFADQLYAPKGPATDDKGRIRVDDWEMRPEIQEIVAGFWTRVNTENLLELSDFSGYQKEFLKLFGFGLPGVDYEAEADPTKLGGRTAEI
ncbi:MAG: enoyl-ACP reductase FabV [Candidatus Methylacidiphilales bacterium]|nr:enoyl-ACP reductase FabV [Candidatus Methylacidiphilales bacterium]